MNGPNATFWNRMRSTRWPCRGRVAETSSVDLKSGGFMVSSRALIRKFLLSAPMIAVFSSSSGADTSPSFFHEQLHRAKLVAPILKMLESCGSGTGTRQAYVDAISDYMQLCGASDFQLAEVYQCIEDA